MRTVFGLGEERAEPVAIVSGVSQSDQVLSPATSTTHFVSTAPAPTAVDYCSSSCSASSSESNGVVVVLER